MKKILILSAVAVAMVGCSSNDDISDVVKPVKLVDATIGIGMGESATTRAFLGDVTKDEDVPNEYTIAHQFQKNDAMYITDYSGRYPFTVNKNGQTTTINGQWAELEDGKDGILATFPKSAVKSDITVNGQTPTMYFTLSTDQTPYVYTGGTNPQISYDRGAGLAFACANNKRDNLWFLPLVSYLYFYSKEATCTITSTENIAGDYVVTYSGSYGTGTNTQGTDYNTAEGLNKFLTYTASEKTITCHGVQIENHRNQFITSGFNGLGYEYIIAIKPGKYALKSISITPAGADKSAKLPAIEMIPSDLYFLGCVDAPAK